MNKDKYLEMLKGLTDKEIEVLDVAISAIYFKDNSDYLPGLWEIVRVILGDNIDEDGIDIKKLLYILSPELSEEN